MANAYKEVGQLDAAVRHYEEALRLDPHSAGAHVGPGEALMELGRLDDAVAHNRAALQVEPDSALAYSNLGELAAGGHYEFTDEELRHLQSLLTRPGLCAADASLLHCTFATVLDRQGAHEQAFPHFRRGNEFKREVYRQSNKAFDPRRYGELVDAVIACFTRDYFERVRGLGSESEVPVFVVGMVRSGTTFVEQILATHPQVYGASELRDMAQIAAALPGRLGVKSPYPACMAAADGETMQLMADHCLRRLTAGAGTAARVVDKMPHNFLHLGLVATLFPRARVIHCRRDPRDLGTSIYLRNFTWLPYATRFEDIAFVYGQYERLMAHWRRHLPLGVHEAAYEDVVTDTETAARALVAFCGLKWDQRCMVFHKTRRAVQTASRLQVQRPVYRTSVGRWRRYEAALRPLLEAMQAVWQAAEGTAPE
jgi:tetratricopeptide (TPR) repeat protein